MFCTECGSEVSDDAQFCPNCGQNLEGVIDLLKEKSVVSEKSDLEPDFTEPIVSEKPDLKSDFTVNVEGVAEPIPASTMQTIKIAVQNISPKSISGVEVHLSSTSQVRVLTRTKSYGDLSSGQKMSSFFNIRPQQTGIFPLTASLKSGEGHSLTFPLDVIITSTKFHKMPKMKRSYSGGNQELKELAPFIVMGIIGLILMIAGVATFFGRFSGLSITMIVIGFILLSIGTKGRCFCIFCDGCNC
jgi:hypothetical protein